MDVYEIIPDDAVFKLLVVGHDDGTHSVMICIEGFEDPDSADFFCQEFLENGILEVGEQSLMPESIDMAIH